MKIIELKIKPNSKKILIKKVGQILEVHLTKVPEKGKANKQLISIIATYFEVKSSQILILSGEKSTNKKIGILENYN